MAAPSDERPGFRRIAVAFAAIALAGPARQDAAAPRVGAQPLPTAIATGARPRSTATPTRSSACTIALEEARVVPRLLGPDGVARVDFRVRYDLGPHDLPDRVALVVGPIGDDVLPTVADGLVRLVAALELERGTHLAFLPVGRDPAAVRWWSGADGAAHARAALASPPTGAATEDGWQRAIGSAVDALLSSPPRMSRALLVVADGQPTTCETFRCLAGAGALLRDALISFTGVNLTSSQWLSPLAVGTGSASFKLDRVRDERKIDELLHRGRSHAVGLSDARSGTFGWRYLLDIGIDRWLVSDSATMGTYAGAGRIDLSGSFDAWAGTVSKAYYVAPTHKLTIGTLHVVPLADGEHRFTIDLRSHDVCTRNLDFGPLCVHRTGAANAQCRDVIAAMTATAAAPTATATAESTPTPTATPTATAPAGATATASAGPTGGPTPPPTASPPTIAPPPTIASPAPSAPPFVVRLPVAHRER